MKSIKMRERRLRMASYVLENAATVRQCADRFNVSVRTVHLDLGDRLLKDNTGIHNAVKMQLESNLKYKKDNRKKVV